MSKMFSMRMMGSDISVQRHTSEVPNDGKYYVLRGATVVNSFKTKSAAISSMKQILAEEGYQPPKRDDEVLDPTELLREETEELGRYASEMYWGSSYRHGG